MMLNEKLICVDENVIAGSGLITTARVLKAEVLWTPGIHAVRATISQIQAEWKRGVSRVYSQIGEDLFVENIGDEWRWNHSCDPNCMLVGEQLVASRDIPVGEEVAYDYGITEIAFSWDFPCACNSDMCRFWVSNYDFLNRGLFRRKEGRLPHYTILAAERAGHIERVKYRLRSTFNRFRYRLKK